MAVTTAGPTVTTDAVAPEPRPRSASWVVQVTALSLVLGGFLGLALQSQQALRAAGLPGTRFSTLVPYYVALKDANQNLQQQVKELREKTAGYESQMAAGSDMEQTLRKELKSLQMLAGMTAVYGPGLVVTLRDTRKAIPPGADADAGLIHDQDLAAIMNELKAAGAEALAIAGVDGHKQRIIVSSAPRCAGPSIRVNDAALAGPFTIYAIGDPASLESALKIPGGVVEKLMLSFLGMIEFHREATIKLPPYSGSIKFQYAKPLDASKPTDTP
jgi:uncharacterized protein YlxW (UPF0749 family)